MMVYYETDNSHDTSHSHNNSLSEELIQSRVGQQEVGPENLCNENKEHNDLYWITQQWFETRKIKTRMLECCQNVVLQMKYLCADSTTSKICLELKAKWLRFLLVL